MESALNCQQHGGAKLFLVFYSDNANSIIMAASQCRMTRMYGWMEIQCLFFAFTLFQSVF